MEEIRDVENSTSGRKVGEKDTLSKSRDLAVQIVYLFELWIFIYLFVVFPKSHFKETIGVDFIAKLLFWNVILEN